MMTSSFAVDAIEYRMSISLKQTLKTLSRKENGLEEILQGHFLKGMFLKLSQSQLFQDILFPGLSSEGLQGIPKNLHEIINWDQISLDHTKIIRNAKEVLQNIQNKGRKEGNVMDEQTEMILLPQIVQEALANHIVDLVRGLSRKVSNTVAQLSQNIASPNSPDAFREQLEPATISQLSTDKFCIQKDYLGSDWSTILNKDCVRFCQFEKLTKLDEFGNMMVDHIDENPENKGKAWTEVCWIELDEQLQQFYPAISIAIDQLYALPHELNAKYFPPEQPLLEISRGCTMLVRYPIGATQAIRLDCKANNLKLDSGIRMTAIYHIRCRHTIDLEPIITSSNSHFPPKLSLSRMEGKRTSRNISIDVEDDMLTMHHSTDIRNEREAASDEWFALICFMHGKLS